MLRDSEATRVNSPLEERARELEIDLLLQLGRSRERAIAVDAYLQRFPGTPKADALRHETEQ